MDETNKSFLVSNKKKITLLELTIIIPILQFIYAKDLKYLA